MRQVSQSGARRAGIATVCWHAVWVIVAVLGSGRPAAAQTYVEEFRFRQPSPETDALTSTVTLDGDTAVIVGTEQLQNPARRPGAVFVYRKVGGQWTQEQRIVDPATQHGDNFGRSMKVEGNTLVVGAPSGCDSSRGAFSIYERTGSTWTLQRAYVTGGTQDQCLGISASLSGDTAAVGAPNLVSPSVHVVRRVNGAWGDVVRVQPPSNPTRFAFGSSVGLSGDTMCVMSRLVTGAAQLDVFTRSGGGTWSLQQGIALPPSTLTADGMSCAVDGNTLIAANGTHSTGSSPIAQYLGIAQVYTRTNGVWTLQQTLPGPATPNAQFGMSVSLRGNEAVVGASGAQVAYVYRRTGAAWTQAQAIAKVTANPNTIPGAVGVSLSASGVLVGQAGHSHGIYVPSAAPTTPGAPANFAATATGNTISMSWGAPTSGSPATSYTLLARLAPGAAPVATVPLGNVTSFAATGPNGTFLLSVRASNAQGDGPESNTVTVALPGGAAVPPEAPTGLGVTVSGTNVTFSWTAPVSGGAPTGYLLVAGLTPGFTAPIASVPTPAGSLGLSVPGVPPGTYYARVQATNAAGASMPSNEVTVTVAGASAPGAPVLNTPVVSGSTVTLSWTPGPGGTPTSYTLIAATTPGGAPIVTVPLSGSGASFAGVPSGTYYLRLTAANAAGTSAASSQVTLVVP